MDNLTKQINAESANQELQIQLIKAEKYKLAFEQLAKEVKFCAHMNTILAWKTLPYVLEYIKEKNNIKT